MSLSHQLEMLGVELAPVFEKLGLPAYLVDTEGRIRWQNAAAVALTGDRRGRLFTSSVAPDYRHGARTSFTRQLLGTDGVVEVESVALASDGGRRAVQVSRIPLENADGVAAVFGIALPLGTAVAPRPATRLAPRQRETLRLLAKGLSTDEIATELGVTRETARNYIRRLLRILEARSRLEAVVRARERGLL